MTLLIDPRRAILPVDGAGVLRPLGLNEARISPDGYWGAWQTVNSRAMIDHCDEWMQRVGWIGNLEAAAQGTLPDARRGREFTDSDVFKLVEAMSWEHGRMPTPAREQRIQELTAVIAAAQEDDGYINTQFGRPGQRPRYSDLEWGHELYSYGHLLQAAVARGRTAGHDELLSVATRVADHVCEVFGEGGIESVCGHPEIELGLMEFARMTGEEKYRRQAELFLERRGTGVLGHIEYGAEYFQDDIPIRDATVLRGHAVRALYLAAAAVDLAVDRDDRALLAAIERQWENTVRARTYITGGMGAHHQDEAFGADFELPSDRAYCETCAGVGAFMLSWRLLLATGEARYADMMERVLFNVVATSPAEDGRSFFYTNTLHQRTPGVPGEPGEQNHRAASSMRAPWFDVSCCPTNVARTFASLDAYVATAEADGVRVHLYTTCEISADLGGGRVADIRLRTDYPENGIVRIDVPASSGDPWNLMLRIPDWANGAEIDRGGSTDAVSPGWATVGGLGSEDESIELRLPMAPRFTFGDPRIDAARGAVAVERGPLVYCVESSDLPGEMHVDAVTVDTGVPLRADGLRVTATGRLTPLGDEPWPYGGPSSTDGSGVVEIPLTPYNSWGAKPSTMRVWMRTA